MKHEHTGDPSACPEYRSLSRRRFLGGTGLASAAGLTLPAWFPRVAFGRSNGAASRDVMVHVFLRGGADGLSIVVPHGDPDLYTARPNLAVPPPGQPDGALDLDGFFGLNPNAAPLLDLYNNGHLALVHAAGSTDPTRSHFDAMKAMEGGVPGQPLTFVKDGWLARHLEGTPPVGSGLLRGIALQDIMPLHLTGTDSALPVADPAGFDFPGRLLTEPDRRLVLETVYASAQEPLAGAAAGTFATIDLLATIDFDNYASSGAVPYPTSVFGEQLRLTAAMVKAGIDLEAVGIDYGGWDHHENTGPISGILAILLGDLSLSLQAFYLDLAADGFLDSTVVLLMSEFGRRVAENVSLGVDHGHGNMMMAIGGHIAGGQVFASWPGLAPPNLVNGEDLAITIDYRDVTGEILANRMGNTNLPAIFPNHTFNFVGITV